MDQFIVKILVVDDNAQNRALARATLEDEGYAVVLAENGDEGLQAVQSERPDCVLLDVRMPGTDGFAVCARIRALPEGSDTPVVFLTALRESTPSIEHCAPAATIFSPNPCGPRSSYCGCTPRSSCAG
jgi:CheY-like chemotaxis protein